MAINKVVNKSTKTHGAMRNVIEYALRNEKVREGFAEISGPYDYDSLSWDHVYNAFLEEKRLWDKDSGRMYAHNIISFHQDEQITPAEVLDMGRQFASRFFPDHQSLICVHQDKNHLHCHIVTNSVSYIDGHKLHQTKKDLEQQKAFTNQLCQEKGLSVAEKGRHFDGTSIETGDIICWKKDTYQALLKDDGKTHKSYLIDCASAVLEAKESSASKEEFIECLERSGWKTTWSDTKKNITFEDQDGHKVRNTNLEKTFHLDIGKEALQHEFERQAAEKRRVREQSKEYEQRYAEFKRVSAGLDKPAVGSDTEARLRTSEASLRNAEKGRENSEAERKTRDVERKDRTVKQQRSRTAGKQKDKGISR